MATANGPTIRMGQLNPGVEDLLRARRVIWAFRPALDWFPVTQLSAVEVNGPRLPVFRGKKPT